MSRRKLSLERSRKELLVEMSKQRGPEQCADVTIRFTNQDVPKFLAHLSRVGDKFRRSELEVGYPAVAQSFAKQALGTKTAPTTRSPQMGAAQIGA